MTHAGDTTGPSGGVPAARRALVFTAPRGVEVIEEPCPAPGPGEVLLRAEASAISPGTELLLWRGELPDDMPLDATLSGYGGAAGYPLRYGYALAGRVIVLGEGVDPGLLGRRAFAFQPHVSHAVVSAGELHPIPEEVPVEGALCLPTMETAANLILDAAPRLGEKVVVFGQGLVGLAATAVLSRFPLGKLVSVEADPARCRSDSGADEVVRTEGDAVAKVREVIGAKEPEDGADLVLELTGQPSALDDALEVCGYHGRVVVGSWYGEKTAPLHLGGRFHRSGIRLVSSQVSTLAPEHRGRWDRGRRFELAWDLIRELKPQRWLQDALPLARAAEAYEALERHDGPLGVVLVCEDGERR